MVFQARLATTIGGKPGDTTLLYLSGLGSVNLDAIVTTQLWIHMVIML